MKPIELIEIIDTGAVETLTMYYEGMHAVVDVRKFRELPTELPDYEIAKIWNSENGRGISILLADAIVSSWEYIGGAADVLRCENCSCFALTDYKVCPKCKAIMKGAKNE